MTKTIRARGEASNGRERESYPGFQARVRAACVTEINSSPGCEIRAVVSCEQWTEAETAGLRRLIAYEWIPHSKPEDIAAYQRFRAALYGVMAYAQKPAVPGDACAEFLASLAKDLAPIRALPEFARLKPIFRPPPWLELPERDRLVHCFLAAFGMSSLDRQPKCPTARELALLSLLAGNFPDGARKEFGSAKRPTVAHVIGLEEKAMRAAWSRADKRGIGTSILVPTVQDSTGLRFVLPVPRRGVGNGN